MTISKYSRFRNGVQIAGMPVLNTYAKNVWWVDSVTGSNGGSGAPRNGKSPDKPFATIDYASSVASRGDIIMAMPTHVETVTAAAGLEFNTPGIVVYFMGEGQQRAKINYTTAATADLNVGSADVTLINPYFTGTVDGLTGPIDVNAAGFTVLNGEWKDTSGTVDCVVADANADRMTIDGWRYVAGTNGSTEQSQIQFAGADQVSLRNIDIQGAFGTACIENNTAAATNLILEDVQNVVNTTAGKPSISLYAGTDVRGGAFSLEPGDHWVRYTANLSSAQGDGSATTHEILTVTGLNKVRIIPTFTRSTATNPVSSKIALGTEVSGTRFIGTTSADSLTSGDIWWTSTSAANLAIISSEASAAQCIVFNSDIGYTVSTSATSAGQIDFDMYWTPLAPGAVCKKGAGGTL